MDYFQIVNNEMKKVEVTADFMEKEVFSYMDKVQRHPMSKELTETMVRLMFAKGKINIPEKDKPFELKVVESRLKGLTITIEDQGLLLLLCVIERSVGTAVLYLLYLQYWCKKHNIRKMDMDTFTTRVFPWGFPSTEDLHTIYDKQKLIKEDESGRRGSINIMDVPFAYQSTQFE